MNKLKQILQEKKLIIAVTSFKKYAINMMEINKDLMGFQRPAFITLNKTASSLIENFTKAKLNSDKVFFIDGMSKTTSKPAELKNCIFLKSPNDLTGLNITMRKVFEKYGPDIIIFNSLSSLLIHEKPTPILRFMHKLIGLLRLHDSNIVFIVLESDVESNLIKQLEEFVDSITYID